MTAHETRKRYNALPTDQRQIIGGAMVDELLHLVDVGSVNREKIIDMVESYIDIIKEGNHETRRNQTGLKKVS